MRLSGHYSNHSPAFTGVLDADGFEKRSRRICTPWFVQLAHILRPTLTTRAFERNLIAVAPEITSIFEQEMADRGVESASASDRVAAQVVRERAGAGSREQR